jgi:hypothetical protein
MGKYDDIINLPHHVSEKHPRMSLEQRSAQFAPFAALTGHAEAINETARLTDKKIEIDDELKEIINIKLQKIKEKINLKPKVSITYFVPDKKKSGGEYVTITENVKKIDEYNHEIIMNDNRKISIKDIIDIIESQ